MNLLHYDCRGVVSVIVNMMSLWLCGAASFRSGLLVIHTTKDPGLFEVKE
jgi:hypothetical protein